MVKITHNNRCSKSRNSLKILQDSGIQFQTINYLNGELSKKDFLEILKKLNFTANQITRKGEKIFKEKFKKDWEKFSENQKIKILLENPILIERPIIWDEKKAVIGRPPENVNIFLK